MYICKQLYMYICMYLNLFCLVPCTAYRQPGSAMAVGVSRRAGGDGCGGGGGAAPPWRRQDLFERPYCL